jgi:transketolase
MAIAGKHIEARFGKNSGVFAHRVFAIVSDGDLMEGIASEAASLAGHLGLGNIVYIYDDNHVTIDGHTDITFSEDVCGRFEAYGWHTLAVEDANDLGALTAAIKKGCAETGRPTLIRVRSIIGYGSPNRQNTSKAHGQALGADEVKLTKQFFGWPLEPDFYVPDEALAEFRRAIERGEQLESEWNRQYEQWSRSNPAEAGQIAQMLKGELPDGWDSDLPVFTPKDTLATRESASRAENAIAARVPALIGGSADLNESTFTDIKDGGSFGKGNYQGRNLHFGIREHGMCAILNGIALHGGLIPLGSSFFVFTDYCRASIRLAALMGLHVIYVFTHDSIGVGEDGPTHQPVEHLTAMRAIPNLTVIRPCDANEAAEAWRVAMSHRGGPVMLVLCRQKLPTLDRSRVAAASGLARGAYVLSETAGVVPQIILIATGSEVGLALSAKDELEKRGKAVRVVSMPSFELFEAQDQAYRDSVLPPSIRRRLAIEAAVPLSWYRWVGLDGDVVGMTTFGASAPYQDAMRHFGFTVENVVNRAMALLAR